MKTRIRTGVCAAAALALFPVLTACGQDAKPQAGREAAPLHDAAGGSAGKSAPTPQSARTDAAPTAELPGLGPRTRGGIGPDTRQALVVTGRDRDSSDAEAVLYEKTGEGWKAGATWRAQNARRGWTEHHVQGDLRTPIGVYGLTDAGGLLPDPGTKLPYDRGRGYTIDRTDDSGQSLRGSFDYVVAINYNRYEGRNPLDWGRPLGAQRGGGIWLHVEHTTPTQGCVALKREVMRELLRTLDPAKKPVVVMGPQGDLAR
ncbi:lipoprotein [Streptomyces spiroverticillatus]|uniref:Lipoprotein n=1 Tax=Streptomyces finlayi TaxID=67296 RepID=A0A918WUB2_9ACTN|nr:L,D-transpeptidase family protein [Streptomyces finlayi]GGZ98462.1 lipoprotein [Streptomyces spiroverticillatus]GHC83349.1 lipoprotein [Streptomyces finlayi]